MSSLSCSISVDELAELVVGDIAARGLVTGDRYFTSEEARQRFGVPRAAMDSAMRMLSSREVLVRRQKAGTFVGPRVEASSLSHTLLHKVFVLSTATVAGTYLKADDVIEVLWQELPGVSVEFVRLPAANPADYVRSLIDRAATVGERVAFVPISASREVYALLASARLPAVVLGSVGPEIDRNLCTVDGDSTAAGRMLVEYLLGQGRRRVSVLMPEAWRAGDNLFYEAVRQAMGEAGMPVTSLCVRSVPLDVRAFRDHVYSLLAQDDRPDAVISRQGLFHATPHSAAQADWAPRLVADVARELGLSVPGDVNIVYDLGRDLPTHPLPFPCTHRLETWAQTLVRVAASLQSQAAGETSPLGNRQWLPVGLYEAENPND